MSDPANQAHQHALHAGRVLDQYEALWKFRGSVGESSESFGPRGFRSQWPPLATKSQRLSAMICLVCAFFAGCLEFGNDSELVGPQVTPQHLQQVSSLTGIDFPAGSVGLAYLFLGSGIDDALAVKVAIPADQKEVFLENVIFQQGRSDSPRIQIGKSKKWWKLESLTDRTDRLLDLPQGRFVECTLGLEEGQLVVYISWMST